MLVIIASAVLYTEIKDQIIKSLAEWLSVIWGTWELRILVLASLILQFILVKYGYRRRCTATGIIPPLVWSVYLLADWVATVTLSNQFRSVRSFKPITPLPPTTTLNVEINRINKLKNLKFSLRTFWTPFLLLHLGGPDTITAYSLEDIELWLRRLMGVGIQVGLVIYMSFTYFSPSIMMPNDLLPFVAIPVFIAGTIKCVDRIWSLWSASTKQWRSSLFSTPPKDKDEEEIVTSSSSAITSTTSNIIDMKRLTQEPLDCSRVYLRAKRHHEAYLLFHVLKFLYGGVYLTISKDLGSKFTTPGSTTISHEDAFEMVDLEIGFLYDVLYTKFPVIQSNLGRILRIMSFFCSISALVAFSVIINRPPYSMLNRSDVDVGITYLLLVGSVLVEIYWVFYHIFSGWTLLWLSRNKDNRLFTSLYDFIFLLKSIPSRARRKTTMSMAQHSIIRLSLNTATAKRFGCMKLFQSFHKVCGYMFSTLKNVDSDLKNSIFEYLNSHHMVYGFSGFTYESLKGILERRGYEPISTRYSKDVEFKWSISDVEFDHSILLWHIATDMLYYHEKYSEGKVSEECERSKLISDYMFYLLLTVPSMMPNGISDLKIRDTCMEAVEALERTKNKGTEEVAWEAMRKYGRTGRGRSKKRAGDGNKSLLRDGIKLYNQLWEVKLDLEDGNNERWKMINEVWIEMLTYAASHSDWKRHGKQLGRGDELLTHVSLLMAHLGFSEQIKFSELAENETPQYKKLPDPAQNLQYYLLCCLD